MSEKIYIIQQVNCRGEESKTKSSYDREMFSKLLDVFTEDSLDKDGDIKDEVRAKIEEISGSDDWWLVDLLFNLLFGCDQFMDTGKTLQEKVEAIKNGQYCAELEEEVIAVGLSKKEAKANLIEIEEEDEW